jgi:acyl-CoA dehydrogenase
MDFNHSERSLVLLDRVKAFMAEHVYPIEDEAFAALDREVSAEVAFPQILLDVRARAKAEGLWNLAIPDERFGPGLTNVEYGLVSEEIGRSSFVAPYAFNVQPPDSGNMEILAEHATPAQAEQWLEPLLEGDIRSCYSMTEPGVPGSDPTGLQCRAVLEGDEWVINGKKWWTTNALGASVAIVMTVTAPDAAPHKRATMILVPTDTPGFNMIRPLSHMGHSAGPGHWEIHYEDCRVPKDNALGAPGSGFGIAQDRLGPGRIHHCMRLIGSAERALELMCQRAKDRVMFGSVLADKQFIQDFIALSRMEIHQARLMTQHAAWKMDTQGKKEARNELSMAKVVVPNMLQQVCDRAIQVWGAAGVCDDEQPLAAMWRFNRMLRIGDGADEVHKRGIARQELRQYSDKPAPTPVGATA